MTSMIPVQGYTGIVELIGSNPIQAWIFFLAFFSLLLKYCSLLQRLLSYSYVWKHAKPQKQKSENSMAPKT